MANIPVVFKTFSQYNITHNNLVSYVGGGYYMLFNFYEYIRKDLEIKKTYLKSAENEIAEKNLVLLQLSSRVCETFSVNS